jgi:hypothetical protein
MKKMLAIATLFVGWMAAGIAAQEPQMPKPQKEHEWLKKFVGNWDADIEAVMAPGTPAMKWKGTESVRAIGGFWIMTENKGEFMGTSFTGIMTLGYDPQKKKYVGTWVDSMQHKLWTYEGSVDAAGKKITLDTEGPGPLDPSKNAKFKESIEFKSDDHKVFTSQMQGPDGKWITFMTINYKRKK